MAAASLATQSAVIAAAVAPVAMQDVGTDPMDISGAPSFSTPSHPHLLDFSIASGRPALASFGALLASACGPHALATDAIVRIASTVPDAQPFALAAELAQRCAVLAGATPIGDHNHTAAAALLPLLGRAAVAASLAVAAAAPTRPPPAPLVISFWNGSGGGARLDPAAGAVLPPQAAEALASAVRYAAASAAASIRAACDGCAARAFAALRLLVPLLVPAHASIPYVF
jgi:hypothetical protein